MSTLRVVDAGGVDAYRSQALWHGIASAVRSDSPPTLSFCRPTEPYVGLGYHRSLAEIDLEACRRRGLPVIRRRIGGGPVYLDSDQLFFQITLPATSAPARVDRLYERCLEPAAAAFRTLGLAVRRNGVNDLAVGEGGGAGPRKVSGTGAGRIGDGVTVVGNVLFRFPHERMVEVLAFPGERLRRECLRLMKRHVSSLAAEGLGGVGFAEARAALVEAYVAAFGAGAEASRLTAAEEAEIERWEERFRDPSWLAGHPGPGRSVRQVKISADAWVLAATDGGVEVEASIVGGRFECVAIDGSGLDGAGEAIARALVGEEARTAALRNVLAPFEDHGRRILKLLDEAPFDHYIP